MPPDRDRRDEALLVIRAQLADRASRDDLLRSCAARLRPYLISLLADAHAADDVLQDTLVIIWRRLPQLSEPRALWAWAFRIATREARRAIRRRSRRRDAVARLRDNPPDHLLATADPPPILPADDRRQLLEGIDALPPNSREVIALHYVGGLSIAAVAAALAIPPGTAKSRLNQALARLRDELTNPKERPP